ncbi:MAG: 3-oxoacyl-ACP reductase FabG [Clostridia bacterium]|nr:3-oxoacyl-ACP reductase FabG [Clostridia bacterium]
MNKKVLITGATGGIGKALAIEFAEAGYDIILHYNSDEKGAYNLKEEIESKYNVCAYPVKADISCATEVISLAHISMTMAGKIDVLINNAGIAYQELFQFADDSRIRALFEINLMSAMNLTKELLPSMINAHSGCIINISSMWGIMGASCEVHYSASKSALIGFTKSLAKEVGPSGITVNCIAPGFIDTKMNAHLSQADIDEITDATPLMRKGKPEDVAALAVFLASEKASFITGQTIAVDGGYAV